jgi:hypothetical protein
LEDTWRAARLAGDHEGQALALGRRTRAAVRIALETNRERTPDTPCGIAATLLLVSIVRNCRAVVHLCSFGFDREAIVLNRASVEAMITLHFVTEADCGRYAELTKARLIQRKAESFADVDATKTDAALERGKAVADDFPSPDRWAAKLNVKNLYVMSRGNPTLEWYYDIAYWYGSLHTHSNAAALDELFSVNADGEPAFRLSPPRIDRGAAPDASARRAKSRIERGNLDDT